MGRGSRCTLAILFLFLLPALACNDSSPTISPAGLDPSRYPLHWTEIVDEDALVGVQPLNSDQEVDDREWVVFCRTDGEDDSSEDILIDAYTYRLCDVGETPVASLIPHPLDLPDNEHHCCYEAKDHLCSCKAESVDVLSACGGDELIVYQECAGEWSRLFVYAWMDCADGYLGLDFFQGDDIRLETDRVVVRQNMPSSAHLIFECVHQPCQDACRPNPFNAYWCRNCEYLFPGEAPPDDVLSSPHPEWVVMAFYYDFPGDNGDDLEVYFREDEWGRLGGCDGGRCGCGSSPEGVSSVRVTQLDITEERSYTESEHTPVPTHDEAIISVHIECKYNGDNDEQGFDQIWHVRWDDDRWWLSQE